MAMIQGEGVTGDLLAGTAAGQYAGYPCRRHVSDRLDIIRVPDGELLYAPDFFPVDLSDRAYYRLLANASCDSDTTDWYATTPESVDWDLIPWRQDHLQMFGRRVAIPRFTAWHGDAGCIYTYSGLTMQPTPWNPVLSWFREQLQQVLNTRFNCVMLNWYRGGRDSMSWHADDEPELGKSPVIASVNLGVTRRFLLRRNDDHGTKIEFPLSHGSLLVMQGELQRYWQHSVPKEKRVQGSRINLTFRYIHALTNQQS